MGSLSLNMKVTALGFLPCLALAKHVKVVYKINHDNREDMLDSVNDVIDGVSGSPNRKPSSNYYVSGDMIINHGVINHGAEASHDDRLPNYGHWFVKCFLNDSQKRRFQDLDDGEMEISEDSKPVMRTNVTMQGDKDS